MARKLIKISQKLMGNVYFLSIIFHKLATLHCGYTTLK